MTDDLAGCGVKVLEEVMTSAEKSIRAINITQAEVSSISSFIFQNSTLILQYSITFISFYVFITNSHRANRGNHKF